jgi:hypothetical protein
MPRVGFEPTFPAFERAKAVHALDRVTPVIAYESSGSIKFSEIPAQLAASQKRAQFHGVSYVMHLLTYT